MVTKATKEFVDQTGRRKVKGNMDIELAVDAMEIAPHIDQMVLFSGDGDFRSLVEAVQRRGVRVVVVSTISTQPPMVADELRRQADQFVDIVELQNKIGRDPGERAARERESRGTRASRRHTPQFLQRSTGAAVRRASRSKTTTNSTTSERLPDRPVMLGAAQRKARPRLPALPAPRRLPHAHGAQREPGWFNAPVPSFGPIDARLLIVGLAPGLRGANRTGRPFTGDYAGDLLYATLIDFGFARGAIDARPDDGLDAGRLPHHQCGALRAAGEQADAARNHHLPRFSQPRRSRKCRSSAPSSRSAASRTRRVVSARSAQPRATHPFAHGARTGDGRDRAVR